MPPLCHISGRPPVACRRAVACRHAAPRQARTQGSAGWHQCQHLGQQSHARRRLVACQDSASAVASDVPAEKPAGASFAAAVFSVLNILMGVGLLSVPYALSKSGYAGVAILLLLAVVTNYSGKALVRCANTVADRGEVEAGAMVRYEDIARTAFGNFGKTIIAAIMYTELVGTCALLLILESDSLWSVAGPTLKEQGASALGGLGSWIATQRGVFWLAMAIVVPTVCAPNVASLSFLGVCGFAATATVTATVATLLFSGSFTPGAVTSMVNWGDMPLVFGIMAFCYSGHAVFPSIQASMREPERFPAVLNVAYVVVAALCTFLGLAGYYMYGDGAMDVITFNMRSGAAAVLQHPHSDIRDSMWWVKTVCASVILVNPIAKFALTIEPVALNVRSSVLGGLKSSQSYLSRTMVNLGVAAGVVMVARFVPYLSTVMSLVGAFLTITISIIFPAAASYKLHAKDMSAGARLWDIFVMTLGVGCAISGTAAALISLKSKMGM